MKERPILFSGEMVRAILDGRKTQTRRTINTDSFRVLLPDGIRGDFPFRHVKAKAGFHLAKLNKNGAVSVLADDGKNWLGVKMQEFLLLSKYGKPGDRLWVRETHQIALKAGYHQGAVNFKTGEGLEVHYPATEPTIELFDEEKGTIGHTCRPSIFMRRWASRITLEILNVRVERLNDISEEDAKAEGVSQLFDEKTKRRRPECNIDSWKNYLWHGNWGQYGSGNKKSDAWKYQYSGYEKARDSFSSLWESINGPGSWEANPWVWVIEFRKVKP